MAVVERSKENLKPIMSSERARELALKSAEVRRRKREEAKELELRDLVPLSLKVSKKVMVDYLSGEMGGASGAQAALAAQRDVLDRELGKAIQRIETATSETTFAEMSPEEKRLQLARLQAKLAELSKLEVADEPGDQTATG